MKKILIYGDSNTWGDNFFTGVRIDDDKQWPNILKENIKDKYIVFQEGLPGRLAGNEEVNKPYKNGKDTFLSTFRTCAPIDILIIALGTNDLQMGYKKESKKVIEDILWYEKILKESYEDIDDKKKYFNNKFPKIIYILPTNFDYKDRASIIFDEDSNNKRKDIVKYFEDNRDKYCFINIDDMSLFEDGIHYNYDDHERMARVVLEVLNNE